MDMQIVNSLKYTVISISVSINVTVKRGKTYFQGKCWNYFVLSMYIQYLPGCNIRRVFTYNLTDVGLIEVRSHTVTYRPSEPKTLFAHDP